MHPQIQNISRHMNCNQTCLYEDCDCVSEPANKYLLNIVLIFNFQMAPQFFYKACDLVWPKKHSAPSIKHFYAFPVFTLKNLYIENYQFMLTLICHHFVGWLAGAHSKIWKFSRNYSDTSFL